LPKAVVTVDLYGQCPDYARIEPLCTKYGIPLIEDAAEALGATCHGKPAGAFGVASIFSFNGNKIITTGGGGALLTNDTELARHAKHLTTTAKLPHAWEYQHDEIGFNYRLPNLNAALGCAQLEQLPARLSAKRALFQRYQTAFARLTGLRLIAEPDHCQSNYWLQTLLLDTAQAHQRDAVLKATNDAGLMTRPAWTLLHELPPFKSAPRMDLSCALSLSRRLINIPSSPGLL